MSSNITVACYNRHPELHAIIRLAGWAKGIDCTVDDETLVEACAVFEKKVRKYVQEHDNPLFTQETPT